MQTPPDKPKSPEFLGPGYDLNAYWHDLMGGQIRWIATILAIASMGLLGCLLGGVAPLEIHYPFHARGPAVLWFVGGASLLWTWLAIVNWRGHLRNTRRKHEDPQS